MLQRKIILGMILIFLVLILSSFLLAQMQKYKDYTVIKGDTLWDISKKELENPFSWPKVWKENPGITNPDKIYPGQKIKIPLYLLQKEITLPEIPEVRKSEKLEKKEEPKKEIAKRIGPPKREYLVDKDLLIASGYITDPVQSVGSIVDSPSGRSILGKGDYAYIKTYKPTKVGEKFYVIRSAGKVTHPKSGLVLGYLIEVFGIAEVIGQDNGETKIKITASYTDISPGSLLDSYSEVELPYRPETPRKPSINGYVVATKGLRILNGMWDIVYIDKGSKEGLKVGDLFATTIQGKHGAVNSVIQIINLKESTATAIIRKSSDIVTKGDEVISLK